MERAAKAMQARFRQRQNDKSRSTSHSGEPSATSPKSTPTATPAPTVYQRVNAGEALIQDTAEYFKGTSNYLEEEDLSLRWKVKQPDQDPTTWRTLGKSVRTVLQTPSPYPVTGAKTLMYQAENAIIKQLHHDLQDEETSSNYCCGGEVPIAFPDSPPISPSTKQLVSPPITLRWDPRTGPLTGRRMKFPTSVSLSPLINDCSPSWGGGHTSWKLESSRFATDFSPQNVGITAAIQKVLLPMAAMERYAATEDFCTMERMGVLAELKYLKVLQAPFETMTPRQEMAEYPSHFGYLFCLLPYSCLSHGGGVKVYGREGSSVTFDWSPSPVSGVQWVAIYAGDAGTIDTPSTQFRGFQTGCRVMLCYHLYITEGINSGPISPLLILDPTRHPFYQNIQDIFRNGNFMKKGGTVGFYCVHFYSHTDDKDRRPVLPTSLKGIDYVVYNAFHELGRYTGIEVHMGAVWASDSTDLFDGIYKKQYGVPPKGVLSRQNPRFERVAPFHEMSICAPWATRARVGHQGSIDNEWKNAKMRVLWLNEAPSRRKAAAFVNVAFNEELDTIVELEFSRAAILIKVPPAETQTMAGGKKKCLSRDVYRVVKFQAKESL